MTHFQKRIKAEVCRRMGRWHAAGPFEEMGPIGAYCLWWAFVTASVLKKNGVHGAQLQAGSAFWPRGRDAEGILGFGYQWEDGPHNLAHLLKHGTMPEFHCWVGIPATQTIIDLTTPFWPERAMTLAGLDWPGEQPPEMFWGTAADAPDGVKYLPSMEAIKMCFSILAGTRVELLKLGA